jgi:hypothetical protein
MPPCFEIIFWLPSIIFLLGIVLFFGFLIKTEIHSNRKMRKIKYQHLYWDCLNRISEMNGGECQRCPKTYYKKDRATED